VLYEVVRNNLETLYGAIDIVHPPRPTHLLLTRPRVWDVSSNRARSCGPTMDLDERNRSVASAILRAEATPLASWEAERAFRDVADLEEEIAVIAGAHRVEGEVARLGAVTASMSAGDLVRAVQLARGPSSASCAAGCARGDSGSLGAISFAR